MVLTPIGMVGVNDLTGLILQHLHHPTGLDAVLFPILHIILWNTGVVSFTDPTPILTWHQPTYNIVN